MKQGIPYQKSHMTVGELRRILASSSIPDDYKVVFNDCYTLNNGYFLSQDFDRLELKATPDRYGQ